MATKSIINIRTDSATKKSAQRVFKKMGLDLSTGVNMYLARVAQDQAMPFTARTVNGFTPEFEARILRETAYAEKHGKRYRTVEEAIRAIS
jgi:addiction module RelB/DinJ family antitoxin